MNRSVLRAATLLALCFAANAAFAAFIPYHDGFNGITIHHVTAQHGASGVDIKQRYR